MFPRTSEVQDQLGKNSPLLSAFVQFVSGWRTDVEDELALRDDRGL